MKRSYILVILFTFLLYIIFNFNNYISSTYNAMALFIGNIISILVALTIILGNKRIESKIAWSIFVLFVPVVGVLFYIILGVEYSRFAKYDKETLSEKDIDKLFYSIFDNYHEIIKKLGKRSEIARLINNISKSPISNNNKVKLLNNGDEKYKFLLEELEKAKIFINFEYFIIKEGFVFDQIKEVLIKKAKLGVEVRFLYDDFGCVDLPKKYLKELKNNGIKVGCFNKINFKIFRPSINYRNHHKIVVIDNKISFMGGINIGDEYAHLDDYYGFWRDTHLMIEGSATRDLNIVFIKSWYHTTGELLDDKKFLKEHKVANDKGAVQIVSDGPHNKVDVLRNSFIKLINEANKRVWIVTPYLILDNELSIALKLAAASGVDVRIIVPGLHDKGKKIVYKATESFFNELLEYGVKIYKYQNLFIHSKILIIDNDVASVGTVNFDYRSFDLHFEVTAIIYTDPVIKDLINSYENDLANSTQVMYEMWQKRSFGQKVIESLVKIFSPLL
ncbi:MAG: cardiolipin synthase [Bacilli bacterium]|nr:cardiolipin synthase [Bacilli bacterium]MDD4282265.1 cardiolipin synthase [Bacilli bacterium]MDD4718411.1 cardiolipin synthase [Bacilli bacterium]